MKKKKIQEAKAGGRKLKNNLETDKRRKEVLNKLLRKKFSKKFQVFLLLLLLLFSILNVIVGMRT